MMKSRSWWFNLSPKLGAEIAQDVECPDLSAPPTSADDRHHGVVPSLQCPETDRVLPAFDMQEGPWISWLLLLASWSFRQRLCSTLSGRSSHVPIIVPLIYSASGWFGFGLSVCISTWISAPSASIPSATCTWSSLKWVG